MYLIDSSIVMMERKWKANEKNKVGLKSGIGSKRCISRSTEMQSNPFSVSFHSTSIPLCYNQFRWPNIEQPSTDIDEIINILLIKLKWVRFASIMNGINKRKLKKTTTWAVSVRMRCWISDCKLKLVSNSSHNIHFSPLISYNYREII